MIDGLGGTIFSIWSKLMWLVYLLRLILVLNLIFYAKAYNPSPAGSGIDNAIPILAVLFPLTIFIVSFFRSGTILRFLVVSCFLYWCCMFALLNIFVLRPDLLSGVLWFFLLQVPPGGGLLVLFYRSNGVREYFKVDQ